MKHSGLTCAQDLRARFESVRLPITIAIGLRLGLGVLAFVAYILYPQSQIRPFPGPTKDTSDIAVLVDRTIHAWSNWDGGWYVWIAEKGYQADPASQAFFPLYPMLVKALGTLLFGNYRLSGVIISTILAVAVFVVFYELVKRDYDPQLAERAVFYLSIFPTTFYLFAAYTEATFMACVLGSFFAARHLRRWWLAGILGALAALTRNLGVFIVIPLLLEWIFHRQHIVKDEMKIPIKLWDAGTWRKLFHPTLFSVGLPAMAFGGWLLYDQLVLGSALTAITSQSSWERGFSFPWNTVMSALRVIFTPGSSGGVTIKIDWYQGNNLLDLGFFAVAALVFLYGCWKTWRREFPSSYLVFFAINFFVPLLAPGKLYPLLSLPRFLLTLFPIFILWAQACQRRSWLHYLTLYLWLPLLGILFILFINGFWVA